MSVKKQKVARRFLITDELNGDFWLESGKDNVLERIKHIVEGQDLEDCMDDLVIYELKGIVDFTIESNIVVKMDGEK